MKFSKRQTLSNVVERELRKQRKQEDRASIASHISFRLKERMPIRLERNKVGWKSDHAKGKSEEGKGVGSRFIFLKRRNGREIKGKIVRKIVNYRNKEIVKMHSSAKEELYFSFLFDLS